MKKIIALCLILFVFVISGCNKKNQDLFASYRGESSTSLFVKSQNALATGKYDDAVKYLEALDAIYPFGPYAQQAQKNIIYAYYMNDNDASAIAAADRYARLYPHGKDIDYVFYMRGIAGFNLGYTWLQKRLNINPGSRDIGNLQQSFSAFSAVVDQYPHSVYAPDSLVRMSYLRNLLAAREISIAKFYLERHAYVAAANRASNVLNHFQGSDQIKESLVILIKCYRELNLPKLEQQTVAILQTNFPA